MAWTGEKRIINLNVEGKRDELSPITSKDKRDGQNPKDESTMEKGVWTHIKDWNSPGSEGKVWGTRSDPIHSEWVNYRILSYDGSSLRPLSLLKIGRRDQTSFYSQDIGGTEECQVNPCPRSRGNLVRYVLRTLKPTITVLTWSPVTTQVGSPLLCQCREERANEGCPRAVNVVTP